MRCGPSRTESSQSSSTIIKFYRNCQLITSHVLSEGNVYACIRRGLLSYPASLWHLHEEVVAYSGSPWRSKINKRLRSAYTGEGILPLEKVIHSQYWYRVASWIDVTTMKKIYYVLQRSNAFWRNLKLFD